MIQVSGRQQHAVLLPWPLLRSTGSSSSSFSLSSAVFINPCPPDPLSWNKAWTGQVWMHPDLKEGFVFIVFTSWSGGRFGKVLSSCLGLELLPVQLNGFISSSCIFYEKERGISWCWICRSGVWDDEKILLPSIPLSLYLILIDLIFVCIFFFSVRLVLKRISVVGCYF